MKFIVVSLGLLCMTASAMEGSKDECRRELLKFVELSALQIDYIGETTLKAQGRPQVGRGFGIDAFLTSLPPLQATDLPEGAADDARIGADFLIGKLVAGRAFESRMPYRENNFISFVGRVAVVEGKKVPLHGDQNNQAVVYRLTIHAANGDIVTTDLIPQTISHGSSKKVEHPYFVHVLKDPHDFVLPEPDAETIKELKALPSGQFEPEGSGESWQDGMSAAEAFREFEAVIAQGNWNKGVLASAWASPQAMEKFLQGKVIAFPEFLSTSGDALYMIVSTYDFHDKSTLKIVSGQIIDVTVTKNNVSGYNIDAFMMTSRGGVREKLYYPARIYWRGKAENDSYSLTEKEQALFHGIDLKPTLIYQKADGPTTYGSAVIVNAFAAGSTGSNQAQERVRNQIVDALTSRGAKIVQDGIPADDTDKKDLTTLVGKLALVVDVQSEDRERAQVEPLLGKIVRIEIAHSTRMTFSDEVSVAFLTVTLETATGVKEIYLNYGMGTRRDNFTAFELR
jgi:hypothetical protein